MGNLFNEILYRPLFNALVIMYQHFSFSDLGIAIILLTILIRFILFPLFYKGAKDQAIIQRLAPKIREIQKNHRHDKEKQTRAMLDLYKEHRVNPFSGFLLLLIQLPILIALYRVFWMGIGKTSATLLYPFVSEPAVINHYFLGLIDLSKRSIIIVLLAAIAQYYQGKLALPKNNNRPYSEISAAERMGKQMVFMGPILTVVFLYFLNLPSAVGVYWLTTSLFSVGQQILINRKIKDLS